MSQLTSAQLGGACRLFMDLAYPGGLASIPPKKQPYYQMPADAKLEDYLPPAALAQGVCQDMAAKKEGKVGYEFRLGSVHFPHMKLRVQELQHRGNTLWVYGVDTHDAFSRGNYAPPDNHPDAAAWRGLQEKNAALKARIEKALEGAGYMTFKRLLGMDLPPDTAA
jgi:hypothetical protein